MTGRERLTAMIRTDRGEMTVWSLAEAREAIDAHADEVLAEDGQAYPGELTMLRGLVRTLRVVVRADDADVAEVRRLLHQHASDDAAAREQVGEKSSPAGADATPDFFQPGHTYTRGSASSTVPAAQWTFKVEAISESPRGDRAALGFLTGATYGCGVWTPHGEHELSGWTDVTEAGDA